MTIHIVPTSKKTLSFVVCLFLFFSELLRGAGCHDGSGRNMGFGVTLCLFPLLTLTVSVLTYSSI